MGWSKGAGYVTQIDERGVTINLGDDKTVRRLHHEVQLLCKQFRLDV